MKKNKLQVNKKDTSEQEINVISKASVALGQLLEL